jgi:hypothetical protein
VCPEISEIQNSCAHTTYDYFYHMTSYINSYSWAGATTRMGPYVAIWEPASAGMRSHHGHGAICSNIGARLSWDAEPSWIWSHVETWEPASTGWWSHHRCGATGWHGNSPRLGCGATTSTGPRGDTGVRLDWDAEAPQVHDHVATQEPA